MAKKDEPKQSKDSKNLETEVENLQQQVAELTDALQRERADAMNVRRRSEEEKAAMSTFYKAMVVRDLLPVIDNFERAMAHHPKPNLEKLNGEGNTTEEWIRGVNKIFSQFQQFLEKLGVEKIKTVGEEFDPKFHEAVQMEDGDGAREVISEELQAGYKLQDEVIRHAMVKVKMEK